VTADGGFVVVQHASIVDAVFKEAFLNGLIQRVQPVQTVLSTGILRPFFLTEKIILAYIKGSTRVSDDVAMLLRENAVLNGASWAGQGVGAITHASFIVFIN